VPRRVEQTSIVEREQAGDRLVHGRIGCFSFPIIRDLIGRPARRGIAALAATGCRGGAAERQPAAAVGASAGVCHPQDPVSGVRKADGVRQVLSITRLGVIRSHTAVFALVTAARSAQRPELSRLQRPLAVVTVMAPLAAHKA